ncbi:unnamed protein product [Protopolystoma xenopodis]|uniref:Uncharacterized protein n=1 Tax=Protopolystoma xenopodis TaxID=117903 RepID=A0A448WT48_9PLAT|nr:unnamed protein product [Protopolystoma xenopodis]
MQGVWCSNCIDPFRQEDGGALRVLRPGNARPLWSESRHFRRVTEARRRELLISWQPGRKEHPGTGPPQPPSSVPCSRRRQTGLWPSGGVTSGWVAEDLEQTVSESWYHVAKADPPLSGH